jgi:2,3-bisphosphoglycerate-dependent phosphoglycerate mutase
VPGSRTPGVASRAGPPTIGVVSGTLAGPADPIAAAAEPVEGPAVQPDGIRQIRFNRPPGAANIYLVRHGETVAARADAPFDLLGGQGDPPLGDRGMAQAERIGQRLARAHGVEAIDAIYVTPLRRTHQTAAPLVALLGIEPAVEPDLREVFLGEWEGGLYRIRITEGDPVAAVMYEQQRWDVIPGAEPDEEFGARVRAGMERIASRHPDQTVAIFTHGGVIARILSDATSSRPFAFLGVDNGSISHVVVSDERTSLRAYNDTAHLDDSPLPA